MTPKGQGGRFAPGALRKKWASPLSKAPFPCPFPFLFDPLVFQEEVVRLLALARSFHDQGLFMVTLHLSTLPAAGDLRWGEGPGWQAGSLPLLLSWPCVGTGEGAAGPGRRQGSRALGWGHIHLPFSGRTYSPRDRCLRSGIPALGPAGTWPGPGAPGSRREPQGGAGLGYQDPYSALPFCPPTVLRAEKNLRLGRRRSWQSGCRLPCLALT